MFKHFNPWTNEHLPFALFSPTCATAQIVAQFIVSSESAPAPVPPWRSWCSSPWTKNKSTRLQKFHRRKLHFKRRCLGASWRARQQPTTLNDGRGNLGPVVALRTSAKPPSTQTILSPPDVSNAHNNADDWADGETGQLLLPQEPQRRNAFIVCHNQLRDCKAHSKKLKTKDETKE